VQKLKLDYWSFTTLSSAGAGWPAATRGRPAAARRNAMQDAGGGSALQASSGAARGTGGASERAAIAGTACGVRARPPRTWDAVSAPPSR
jgi:hypothetical protein